MRNQSYIAKVHVPIGGVRYTPGQPIPPSVMARVTDEDWKSLYRRGAIAVIQGAEVEPDWDDDLQPTEEDDNGELTGDEKGEPSKADQGGNGQDAGEVDPPLEDMDDTDQAPINPRPATGRGRTRKGAVQA